MISSETEKYKPKNSADSGTGSATTSGSFGQTPPPQQIQVPSSQNMYKPQQNSYPFYAPKVAPVKVDGNYDLSSSGIQHSNKGSKSPIRQNPALISQNQYNSAKPVGNTIPPKNYMNSSYGQYPNPNYRDS